MHKPLKCSDWAKGVDVPPLPPSPDLPLISKAVFYVHKKHD